VLATTNVLESVEKSGSVRRVVFTSSTAAVMGAKPYPHVHSEADWGDGGDHGGPKNELPIAYAKSKCGCAHTIREDTRWSSLPIESFVTLCVPPLRCDTERLAYEWAEKNGTFDCISHQPAHVMGPLMCKSHHEIWQLRVAGLLEGKWPWTAEPFRHRVVYFVWESLLKCTKRRLRDSTARGQRKADRADALQHRRHA
jgi:hypothetical protein